MRTLPLLMLLLAQTAWAGPFPPAIYEARRAAALDAMTPGTVAVIFSNPHYTRSNDTQFRFRADSELLYLTGFDEPEAALVLAPGGIEIGGRTVQEALFIAPTTDFSRVWLNPRSTLEEASKATGVEAVSYIASLDEALAGAKNLHSNGLDMPPVGEVGQLAGSLEAAPLDALHTHLNLAREVKGPLEVELLRRTVGITNDALIEAMKSCVPGMYEYELQAIVEYVFARNGAEFYGYPSIVGSGPNSVRLHYDHNRRRMQKDDLVLMDVGAELHGYSADVTRTYPVDGSFSPEQSAIYQIVLDAQNAGIAACVPGAIWQSVDAAIDAVMVRGLVSLGLIENASELGRYYMHGWGHNIGLDVHDPQSTRPFQAGMVLTVEPGIYIREGSPCDQRWWNIGVRIEDDILITESGPENLTGPCPKTIEGIEKLMSKTGIGNVKVGG